MTSQKMNENESKKRLSVFLFNTALFLLLFTGINQTATQYVAKTYNFHPSFGSTYFQNLYPPFKWIEWSATLAPQNEMFFKYLFLYLSLGFVALVMLFAFVRLLSSRKSKAYKDIHGTAHFADRKEIERMQILNQSEGVYIGAYKDPKKGDISYLRHDGPEHILAFAPTRSGKGVGLVIPTLLGWSGSAVILDIKGENWELTAGYRKRYLKNKVMKFDPVSSDNEQSVRFNPLEEIRLGGMYAVADVQNIASIIIDPDGKGLEDHWAKTGFALLTTMILHLCYKCQNEGTTPTLSMLREIINDPKKGDVKSVLAEMIAYKHHRSDDGDTTDPVVAVGAKEAMNKPDNELGSVVSTVVSNLSLYDDPIVARNISKSDFKIKDLMNVSDPISLYLVIKPSDMNRLKPLTRIIINQILTILIGDMKFENGQQKIEYKHRLLLMLDEFTSIGKLPLFETALAYMAGYGIKAYIIIQDLTQLYKAYSKEESIISNCHIRVAYAPNKVETAELLSKMTGTTTVVKIARTTSGSKSSLMLGQISENYQEVQRPLLTIDECMTLPSAKKDSSGKVTEPGDMLIFVAGNPTIYGKQILFFLDPVFSERSKVPSPKKSDLIDEKDRG